MLFRSMKKPLRKKLGDKSNELTSEFRKQILDVFLSFEESDISHIYKNEEFGFWEVTVLRPKYQEDGSIEIDKKGNKVSDKDKTYTEIVPFTYNGGIEEYFNREILPFCDDAWIDGKKTKVGYEVSFTKCFYRPLRLRSFEEVMSELHSLEQETDGMFNEITRGIR